jgi:hypothetical protein
MERTVLYHLWIFMKMLYISDLPNIALINIVLDIPVFAITCVPTQLILKFVLAYSVVLVISAMPEIFLRLNGTS